jgi:NADH-quinone oxidoreductase subunit E
MGEVLIQSSDVEQAVDLKDFCGKPEELISLLQHYQKRYGYISEQSVHQIAALLKVSEAHIYGVASFYTQFRFVKPGDHKVRVCLGTACHVQAGAQLSQEIQAILGIAPGEITPDNRYDFQEVACLGCCAQAPVVEIDGKIFGKMTPDKIRKVLEEGFENDENL